MTVWFSIRKLALCAGCGAKSQLDTISQKSSVLDKFIASDQEGLSPGQWERTLLFIKMNYVNTLYVFIIMRPPTIYWAWLWNNWCQPLLEKYISRRQWKGLWRNEIPQREIWAFLPVDCGWTPAERRYWYSSSVQVLFSNWAPNSRQQTEASHLLNRAFNCQLFLYIFFF